MDVSPEVQEAREETAKALGLEVKDVHYQLCRPTIG